MKKFFLYLMIVLYAAAGINHFRNPGLYMNIMPGWMGAHELLVYLSGVFEIFLALLLVSRSSRKWGAWLIILLLVAIFPANIEMMIDYYQSGNKNLWIAIARLPLQIPLIWWAYQYTKPMASLK